MKTCYQITAIIMLSLIAGFGSNAIRSNSLLVYCRWHIEAQANASVDNPLRISLRKAERLYKNEKAVFIDARPVAAYHAGHIKGALNLPWSEAEEKCFEILQNIPLNQTIVTYCNGEACELGDFLAKFLNDLGYKKAKSLHNGWTRWQTNALPQAYPKG